ncbi:MAG: hypothetical protein JWP12_933 [Bacteroidetes bacterium]|nr:hypothetical protein [Bacteroidota bacterium]
MKINRNNYEAFFLDYHEGNLAPQQVAELLLFVEQHPELKEEFESFENFSLEDLSNISFGDTSGLKKQITVENKDEYFIRAIENNLNPTEQQLVDQFLKQHPQYKVDFELFQKTKLTADRSVVFADKDILKDIAITTDYLLIASVEGLLTKQESSMLNHQLAVDAEMQQNYALYQQTKVTADQTIVFENKEELKRKERKVIPLFYYVAAAAAIILLFGLSVLFNNTNNNTPAVAVKPANEPKIKMENNAVSPVNTKEKDALAATTNITPAKTAAAGKQKNTAPNNSMAVAVNKKEKTIVAPVETPAPIIAQSKEEKQSPAVDPENKTNTTAPVTNEQPAIAQVRPQVKPNNDGPFLSLGEIAATKIKQKTMDEDALKNEKKFGKLNKFSGWDALQVVAKGVSKLTGKKVEVKPTYNDEGEVTAYAFNAGKIGFSKER